MHCQVDAPREQSFVDLLREQPLAADSRRRAVCGCVPRCADDRDSCCDAGMRGFERPLRQRRLGERQRAAARPYGQPPRHRRNRRRDPVPWVHRRIVAARRPTRNPDLGGARRRPLRRRSGLRLSPGAMSVAIERVKKSNGLSRERRRLAGTRAKRAMTQMPARRRRSRGDASIAITEIAASEPQRLTKAPDSYSSSLYSSGSEDHGQDP